MAAMTRSRFIVLRLAGLAFPLLGGCDSVLHRGELPSLEQFEGEIDVLASGSFARGTAEPTPVRVFVQRDKLRFDPPSAAVNGGGSFLIDPLAHQFFVLNPDRKQAIKFELSSTPAKGVPPSITKTGRRVTVAGFGCEEWEVVDADHRKDVVCVADKPASFLDIPVTGGIFGARAWMSAVFDGHHVPLRIVAYDKTGTEAGRIELVRITRRAEDPSLFGVGQGVEVTDLASLLGGRGGAAHEATPHTPGGGLPEPPGTRIPARPAHS
jgi:hypothetical protein